VSGKPMPDAPPLKLFDEIERTETRPKSYREPIYSYYNSSSRRPIAAVRDILQEIRMLLRIGNRWVRLQRVPETGKQFMQINFPERGSVL